MRIKTLDLILSTIMMLIPILLWIDGYYDAFFPTSAYYLLREEQILSQSFVVDHAKLYRDYYPLSLYLIAILSEIVSVQFLHIGHIPITFFLHYLFFSLLLNVSLKGRNNTNDKWYLVVKFMFLCSLLNFAYGYTPLFYITLGSTALVITVYFLIISAIKNIRIFSPAPVELITTFLFGALCMFSYYTSGALIMLTLILFLSMKMAVNFINKSEKPRMILILSIITLSILYFLFDKMFYSHIGTVILSYNEIITTLLERRIASSPIEYQYVPSFLSIIQRISLYVLILLLLIPLVLVISMLSLKFNNSYRNIKDSILLILSFIIANIFQSAIYSFFMGKFYLLIRYLFVVPYIVSILLLKTFPRKVLSKAYFSLLFIYSLLNLIAFLYLFIDEKIFSPRTSYIKFDKMLVLCQFYSFSNLGLNCFSDLKTTFTLPYVCTHSYLKFTPFERSMFQVYNDDLNVLSVTKPGLYIFATQYSQRGIIMENWLLLKPFYVVGDIHRIFDSNEVVVYFH